jgi:hypothetical protein
MTRQRLVRALITEIVVDIDAAAGEIVLIIHWKGGQDSGPRVRGPRTGGPAGPRAIGCEGAGVCAMRRLDNGFAVEFSRVQNPELLKATIAQP